MIKRLLILLLLISAVVAAKAQVVFRTLVTQGPVVVGEPFQVQYVLENIDEKDEFIPPQFKYLRFVSGPNIYVGSVTSNGATRNMRNMVYTLAAVKPGKFMVPGGSAKINGQLIRSDNSFIEVISREEAIRKGLTADLPMPNEEYFLRPGEDAYVKMQRNLFVKVMVDRKSCYVGQPVVATFKLYSRLQSRSDIVKNPGFYGFTVQDMIGLDDKRTSRETINGKKFDVHTVRKVQLYPLQAGSYTIDPMELRNRVEFSKSPIRKKTEQEIVEGLFADPEEMMEPNTVSFENNMHTEPITIEVKPAPVQNRPADFNGATGHFQISAEQNHKETAKNEEVELSIKISGQGNFTQLVPPVINWPKGLDVLEPEITDSLDHSYNSPMKGARTFRFRFVSSKPGTYTIPAISFSFLDPDSNRYRSVSTKEISVVVTNKQRGGTTKADTGVVEKKKRPGVVKWFIACGIFILAIIGFLISVKLAKRKPVTVTSNSGELPAVNELLYRASVLSQGESKTFYGTLRDCIWDFFGSYFGVTGSGMSKQYLANVMEAKNVTMADRLAIFSILDECETGIFTRVDAKGDQLQLLEQTKEVLERIRQVSRA